MGVRARIAEWPPKSKETPPARREAAAAASCRSSTGTQQPSVGVAGFRALQRLARRRAKDVEFQEGWPKSPGKVLAPLRHRSSSEVTLSECDAEEGAEGR
ncbi:SI1L3 protein, partial [Urocolius indicus]|nr:SI1L3 protein [Urocolius indicus]